MVIITVNDIIYVIFMVIVMIVVMAIVMVIVINIIKLTIELPEPTVKNVPMSSTFDVLWNIKSENAHKIHVLSCIVLLIYINQWL